MIPVGPGPQFAERHTAVEEAARQRVGQQDDRRDGEGHRRRDRERERDIDGQADGGAGKAQVLEETREGKVQFRGEIVEDFPGPQRVGVRQACGQIVAKGRDARQTRRLRADRSAVDRLRV